MRELNLNFGKLFWEMFEDERLADLSNDGIILYTRMLDKKNLSIKNNYIDRNGKVYILFTQEEALRRCRIKKNKFFSIKKQLKKLGLIFYDEQSVKKAGVSTPIYVKSYKDWSNEYREPNYDDIASRDDLDSSNESVNLVEGRSLSDEKSQIEKPTESAINESDVVRFDTSSSVENETFQENHFSTYEDIMGEPFLKMNNRKKKSPAADYDQLARMSVTDFMASSYSEDNYDLPF